MHVLLSNLRATLATKVHLTGAMIATGLPVVVVLWALLASNDRSS